MTNTDEFFVPEENYDEIKGVIRSCPTLRFNYNPIKLGGKYQVSISGNTEHLKIVSDYLILVEKPKIEKKKGLLERLAGAFGLD